MVRTFSTGIIISLVAVLTLFVSSAMAQTKLGGSVSFRDDGANAGAKLVTSLIDDIMENLITDCFLERHLALWACKKCKGDNELHKA